MAYGWFVIAEAKYWYTRAHVASSAKVMSNNFTTNWF